MQSIWDDIVGWHPAVTAGAWLGLYTLSLLGAGEIASFNDGSLWIGSPSIAHIILPTIGLWYFALYRAVASRMQSPQGKAYIFQITLALYCILMLSSAALYYERANRPEWLITFVSLLVAASGVSMIICIWTSAAALTRFEQQARGEARSTAGLFFQILYLPISIWFLRVRLSAMLATPHRAMEPVV